MTGNRSPWENPVTWIKPGIISQPFSHYCPDKTSSVMVLDKGRDELSVKKPEATTRKSLVSKAMLYAVWFVMLSPECSALFHAWRTLSEQASAALVHSLLYLNCHNAVVLGGSVLE